jgi:hypothetical protein
MKESAELTNEELALQAKKSKSAYILDAVIIGFLVGIAVYSAVRNGVGLLTFLPLVYLPIAARNRAKHSELKKRLQERGLHQEK